MSSSTLFLFERIGKSHDLSITNIATTTSCHTHSVCPQGLSEGMSELYQAISHKYIAWKVSHPVRISQWLLWLCPQECVSAALSELSGYASGYNTKHYCERIDWNCIRLEMAN